MKKYKLWWLISVTLFTFISFNWVLYGLTGLTMIRPANEGQGVVQCLVWIITAAITVGFSKEGEKGC